MAYQHSQLARECSTVTRPSARLVLMILASAMDKDKHTCFWRWTTLLHYSKLSRSTLATALNQIEACGIITRQHRYRRSNIYVWHPDVAEQLRDPVTQESEDRSRETQAEVKGWDTDGAEVASEDRSVFLGGDLRNTVYPTTRIARSPMRNSGWSLLPTKTGKGSAWRFSAGCYPRTESSVSRSIFLTCQAVDKRKRAVQGNRRAGKAAWPGILEVHARSQAISKTFEIDNEELT